MSAIPDSRRRVIWPQPPAEGIVGTVDVWVNVTDPGMSLDPGYSQTVVPANVDDNYGVQDVIGHPTIAGLFFAFLCYQGCWRSLNYGLTWAKVSGSSVLDLGKNWGSAIPIDGSFLLNTLGNDFSGSPEGRKTIQRSTNGGATWTKSADLGGDPYNVACCPYDVTRGIAAFHDTNHFLESLDSCVTWTDHGAVNAAISNSGYVFYLHNADTAMYIGGDGENSYRGTKAAGVWTWTRVTDLDGAGHVHGTSQMFHDVENGAFFHGAGANVGADGIYKSTNNGTNWTRHYSSAGAASIIGTPSNLYAMLASPAHSGSWNPQFTTAPRNPGTSWAAPTTPSGFLNGAKRLATGTDGVRHVLLAGCWGNGLWRCVVNS
jgi:hypothetical protein